MVTALEQNKLMNLFFDPIKNAIFESDQDRLLVTKNYELLESEPGKNLLDARLFDAKALCAFFDELYQKEDLFYPSDVEIGLNTFTIAYNDPPFVADVNNEIFLNYKPSQCPIK